MKQAYYAVSDRGADFMSGARLDFGADENAVLSDLAYELPHAYHGNLEVGPRRYCLMKLRTGPLLFRTVPVAGVRRNLSFTHLLLLNQPHPLLEYLLGWEDPFWRDAPNPLVPSSQFDESLPWVSPSVKQQRDEEFRQWLADPAHEAWLRFAMLAHLTLPEDGRIFLPIKPIDVFEVVYGLARLLPHKLTESVTFSTYEHAPSSRNLRLIGTFTAVPDLAVRCGKDCVFGSSRDAMPAEPNAAALYLDRALSAWRRRPDALDTFLHRVCAIDSIERLSLLLRATDDPECLSNVELLQLVEDSIGRSMLANSPSLFERVLLRGTKEHAQRLASFVSRECKAGLLAHLAHRAGEAIRANDVRLLRAMLCGLDHVDPSRTQEQVIGSNPPCADFDVFRVLIEWLGDGGIKSSVLAVKSPLANRVLLDADDIDRGLRLRWIRTRLLAFPSDLLAAFVNHNGTLWPALKRDLILVEPTTVAEVIVRLLAASSLRADKRLRGEILALVAELQRAGPNSRPRDDLLLRLLDVQLLTEPDLIRQYDKLSRDQMSAWSGGLRARLARWLLSEKEDNALLRLELRNTLFALTANACELGERKVRRDALYRLARWVEPESPFGAETPETIADALGVLLDWHRAIAGRNASELPLGEEVLVRVVRASSASAGTPEQFNRRLLPWFAALRPTWKRAGRNLVADLSEAAGRSPHLNTRTWLYLALADAANPETEDELKRTVLDQVAKLPSGTRRALVKAVTERSWFLRGIPELSQRSTDPSLRWFLVVFLSGFLLGIALPFIAAALRYLK